MNTDLNNWLMIVIILVLGGLALGAHWLVVTALAPRFVEHCRESYARPILATLLGAVVWAPCLFTAVAVFKLQLVPTLLILTPPYLLATAGASGLALRVGAGLGDGDTPARVLRGGRVLVLAVLTPLIGWLLLLPWLLLSGAGAAVLSLVARRPTR